MKQNDKSGISIKWRMLVYIGAFTLFMLLLVWVFQVLLLGRFYESTKLSELNAAADEISENIDDEEALSALALKYATEYQMYIRIFATENGVSEQIVSGQVFGSFFIRTANDKELSRLTDLAASSSGKTYFERRTVRENYPEFDDAENKGKGEDRKEMICVRIVSGKECDYVVMLNIIYTPLGATVTTLMKQFSWICLVLLGGALILAAVMSKWVSQPLIKMNEEAKKLGKGDFDVSFPRDGYLETRELADTLNFAAGELARTEDLKKELIANLSHDLRTPLTMITGYGEVIRDIPGENTPENIQVIIDESTHLSELVNDLLDLSKIQSGNVKYEYEIFDLTESVRSTLGRYKKFKEHDGFDISFEAEENIFVSADRVRILQVVCNLINNAINYSGDSREIRVVQTSVANGRVRVSVSDRGEGIPPEALPDIWDRYYKVDRIHKRATVGTGLGLSIVKGILEGHGASYGVESKVGHGSTFWFEMPMCSKK